MVKYKKKIFDENHEMNGSSFFRNKRERERLKGKELIKDDGTN